MKKGWIVLISIAAVFVCAFYLFIPNTISLNRQISIAASPQALFRKLQAQHDWAAWWPGTRGNLNQKLIFNGNTYTITNQTLSSFATTVHGKNINVKSTLHLLSIFSDTTLLSWEAAVPVTTSPARRLAAFKAAKTLQHDLDTLLTAIQKYYSKTEHLYQFPIQRELIKDSILIFTSGTSKGYPSTVFVYTLIDRLRTYLENQGASGTGFPMLNISTIDSTDFLTKVSIPVNKMLRSNNLASYRRMPGRFPILVTQVTGGPYRIAQAQQQMEYYLSDYKLAAVAIPFQSLITDRLQEPDTAKWVTKIYYPVVEYPKQ